MDLRYGYKTDQREHISSYAQKVLIRLCVLELPAQTRLPSDIPYMNAH